MRLPCEGEASIKTKSVTDSLLVSSTNDENVLFVTYELYVHSYDKPDGVIIFEIWKESGKQQSTDPVFKPVLETQAKIESTDNTNFYTAVVTLEEGVIKKGDRILCLTRYLSDKKKMFCPKSIKVSLDV
jgi:hypothetical protein